MLNNIIKFSIKNKLIISIFTLALIAWGSYAIKQLPIDAVPDITNNQVQVLTSSPSNGAEDIERFITFPVEQTMATIPDVEEVRSFSRFGLSVVTVVFKEDVDIYWARQQVSSRLTDASKAIPEGMGAPELAPLTTGLGEIYQYVVHTTKGYEKKYDATELRTIQDWIIRRQLLGLPGVADVSSFGGYLKQYEVAINPEKIRSMNISIADVYTALKKNNQNTGGSYIDKKPNAYFIKSEGLIESIADIENIVVKTNKNSTPVLIKNVATVKIGAATRYGAMTRNTDGEVVGGLVLMLKGENAAKVISDVKLRMEQISKSLPEGVVVEPFLDRSKLVNNAISTVTKNLLEGALIVIFVLVLLLGNFRAGLIVASVIPLAMLFAIAMMNLFGVSGNLMSLGAIDFGLIVDGAVIIVEATLHHLNLRKSKTALTQLEMDEEVYQSSSKIRTSAAFGEIIILIVYLPILALIGIEGKMFRPMAQTVSFAILGAFILSLTYVPMVSALFLNKQVSTKKNISDKIIAFFQRVYTPMLNFALRAKMLVLGIAFGLLIIALLIFHSLGSEFIPTLDEGDFAVETRVLTGSSLSQTIEAATRSAKVLQDNFPEVIEVVGKIGSSEIPTDPMPVEACDLMIILKPKKEWTSAKTRDELADKMQAKLQQYVPGVNYGFQQPIQMRFNELMSGARQDVVVKVYGEDLDKLGAYAKKIGKIVSKINGAEDVYVEQVSGLPQVVIKFDRAKIASFGLNVEDVNTVINTAFAGQSAGLVFDGEKRFDLVVRVEKDKRQSLDDIKNIYVTAPNGNQIPLNQLAAIDYKMGPNQIQRDDAKRRILVGFNTRGRDVKSIVEETQKAIAAQIKFEPGYYPTYGGAFENLEAANARLAVAVPVALLLIFFLLYLTFKSVKHALLIFTAIPLSAIGGIFALSLRGMPFSISAGVGFIALFGVAVLNGIVLIAEFNRLKKDGLTNLVDIVKTGTAIRLRPVMLTALVASLGFLPMALSTSSGAEVQKPLATVVIGGLLTATLLTLLVLPILYIVIEKYSLKKTSKIIAPVTIILVMFGFSAKAQTQSLTLKQAVEIAKKNNPNLQSANLQVALQQAKTKGTTDIPKTEFGLQYGQNNSLVKNDNHFTVSQTLPFPTLFSKNKNLASARLENAKLQTAVAENELEYQVSLTYQNLVYLYAQQALINQTDSIFLGFNKSADLRYKTGESTLLESTTANTQRLQVQNRASENQSELDKELLTLKALLGLDGTISISEKEIKTGSTTISENPNSQNNPYLNQLKQEGEIAHKEKSVETAKMLPDLKIGYFNQSIIGTQEVNGQTVFFDGDKRFQGINVGLSVPLFYGAYRSKIKAAEIQKSIASKNTEAYENQLNSELKQAYTEYKQQQKNIRYYEESALKNAKVIERNSNLAYQSGEIGYYEHLTNLKTVIEIKENHLLAIKKTNQSILQINYLLGFPKN
ncbi:CusA/CzcA family heavy metal efflux RND transporter [Pedobacter arcticus]|uniref:CusA/CzcA family heavy metal efflux RND transporter n=1 Tax=Pedobacter arcticus TaxID=752140 RepID=UPI00031C8D0E|nr:CusA/CzcA family heavy metal efflux RND transporter [Pedobacter arcticus]